MLLPSFFLLLFRLQHVKLLKQTTVTNSFTWNLTSNFVTSLGLRIISFAVIASTARAWTCSLAAITSFWACAPRSPRSPNTWGWNQREKKSLYDNGKTAETFSKWNYVQGIIGFFFKIWFGSDHFRASPKSRRNLPLYLFFAKGSKSNKWTSLVLFVCPLKLSDNSSGFTKSFWQWYLLIQ